MKNVIKDKMVTWYPIYVLCLTFFLSPIFSKLVAWNRIKKIICPKVHTSTSFQFHQVPNNPTSSPNSLAPPLYNHSFLFTTTK